MARTTPGGSSGSSDSGRSPESDLTQARAAADAVIRRAAADADFRRQLQRDPEATLRQAGIATDAIGDLRQEIVIGGQPLAASDGVCHITCIVTSNGRLPGDIVDPATDAGKTR